MKGGKKMAPQRKKEKHTYTHNSNFVCFSQCGVNKWTVYEIICWTIYNSSPCCAKHFSDKDMYTFY